MSDTGCGKVSVQVDGLSPARLSTRLYLNLSLNTQLLCASPVFFHWMPCHLPICLNADSWGPTNIAQTATTATNLKQTIHLTSTSQLWVFTRTNTSSP